MWGANAGDPHLLEEERQLVTIRGQPLRVQRSMETQAQPPTGVGRILQPSFLRCQSALENQALSDSGAAPTPQGRGGKGPDVGGGAGAQWAARMSLEARLQITGGRESLSEPANVTAQGKWQTLINVC